MGDHPSAQAGPSISSILADGRSHTSRPTTPVDVLPAQHAKLPSSPGYAMSAKARGKTPVFQGAGIDTARLRSHDSAQSSGSRSASPMRSNGSAHRSAGQDISTAGQNRRPSQEELLMHDAALKMSSKDQEVMSRMRTSMSGPASPVSSLRVPDSPSVGSGHPNDASTSRPPIRNRSSERLPVGNPGLLPQPDKTDLSPSRSSFWKEKGPWARKSRSSTPTSAHSRDKVSQGQQRGLSAQESSLLHPESQSISSRWSVMLAWASRASSAERRPCGARLSQSASP